MKKFVAILLCMTMLFSLTVTAGAVSERNGWVYSNIDSSDVLSVDGLVVGGELENAQTLNVPYAILGMPVIRVGKSAFMNNNTAQNINLTENIREISDSAMYGMTALENVVLPKNLTILGVSAFAYCSSLQSVSFQTVKLSQIKNYTFYGCTQLNNVILSDSITELDDYCFAQCLSMDKIYIPTSVSLISDKAFYGTKNGFTIYGYQNSYAYTYAVENNIPFVDMTEKSLNQLSDLISIAEYMLREENIAPYTTESADILAQMYQNAVAVKNNFFSSPDDIAQMQTQLENAYRSLRLNSMNDLDEAIIQAESTVAASFRYTESSVNDLEKAIHQARTVQNTVLPSETQVQNAIQNLNSKINALVRITENDTRAVLKGCSISLEGDIAINFYMQLDSTVIDSESAYMQFTIPKGETTEIKKVYLKDAFLKEETGENCYLFKCRVAPKEMNSRVKAQFFADGIGGTEYTYSVKNYAYYILAHTEISQYAQAENIVKAMLNYGAYSQLYFDENPDVLVNENLTDEEKYIDDVTAQTVNKPYDSTVQNHLSDGVTFAGATVSLKSKTVLSLYFQSENTLTFSCQKKTLTTAESNGYQIVRINDIAAKEIGDDFTVTVTADGNSGTVIYSPLNYCYNALQTNDNEKLCQVVKALYKYWQAADSYFV